MKVPMLAAVAALCLAIPAIAHAEEEKTDCTTKPQSEWLSTDAVKAQLLKGDYASIRSITTLGSCYEIYAKTKAGKRAEIYVDPATGAVVSTGEGD